jgi:hypothetical protein
MAGDKANANPEKLLLDPARSKWLRLAGWVACIVGGALLYLTWFAFV